MRIGLPVSNRKITWFPAGSDPNFPDGSEVILTGDPGSPFDEVHGAAKFIMPQRIIIEDETPGVPGSQWKSTRTIARDPEYRFTCRAGAVKFLEAIEKLAAALNCDEPGTLVITSNESQDHGYERFIRCLYADGFDGDALLRWSERGGYWAFTLKFRAFDPYWYSREPKVATWTGKPSTLFFPFNPYDFSIDAYGVDETDILDLGGQVESYPTFILGRPDPETGVVGPWLRVKASRLALDKVTGEMVATGESWEKTRSQADPTETVIIDTKPGAAWPKVRNAAGENRYGFSPGHDLFALKPGDAVVVEVDGATEDTVIEMRAPEAWLSAL